MLEKLRRVVRYVRHGIPQQNILKCDIKVSHENQRLQGKHILITGGGRGLGYYMAKRFVDEGASVLIAGRSEETLKKASKELGCQYIAFDVTDIASIPSFMDKVIGLMGGRLDGLVNNAGISLHEGNMMEVTDESFTRQFDTNLKAPYFLTQSFLAHCLKMGNKNASVLFVSSERGLYCDEIPYGLIKSAINSLTRGVARRQIRNGIRVNAIAPGITESDMTIADRTKDMTCNYNCGGRFFLPEEVAETATFLMSDFSQCISGEVIACDQGNYLRCDW